MLVTPSARRRPDFNAGSAGSRLLNIEYVSPATTDIVPGELPL